MIDEAPRTKAGKHLLAVITPTVLLSDEYLRLCIREIEDEAVRATREAYFVTDERQWRGAYSEDAGESHTQPTMEGHDAV